MGAVVSAENMVTKHFLFFSNQLLIELSNEL
jgi:hypothetical protein